MSWLVVSAVASIGGVIATATYAIFFYEKLLEENGLSL